VSCLSPRNSDGNPTSKASPTPFQPRSQAGDDHELNDGRDEDEELERRPDAMSSADEGEADGSEGVEDLNGDADSDGGCSGPPVVSVDEESSDGEEGGEPTKGESQQRVSLVLEGMTRESIWEK